MLPSTPTERETMQFTPAAVHVTMTAGFCKKPIFIFCTIMPEAYYPSLIILFYRPHIIILYSRNLTLQ